ncbi:methylenetetrahydrofolate reductase C-terminal domain-containing protein [Aeromicrobium ginsengisoli]|uniref:Methylenetetrahydrofolate reductase n=1 Tax=Aeromicrobium ginsengisoli TaxID=363867 RepID=A0A5M4FF15_9ACTN|nr:methylenetetrahydrofolate reductase C-terminal domain-containing protein [Aeromicrobium ginsengisoli]KAA1397421.1 methylenetetrahydrofolate reductase [Aeromicrobium ginsengisoli]
MSSPAEQLLSCPKAMVHGPCGGVGLDGTCEVSPAPCVFLDTPTVRWHDIPVPHSTAPRPDAMRQRLREGRVVVADLPAAALSADSIRDCATALRGHVDAVLAGDGGASRVQFPPAYRAGLVQAAGLEVWSGVNNRDRNRVALEGELAALAHAGVAAVHCVTGDHTLTGSRPDAAPVFDLDSTETAALAQAAGHLVSVGESPAAPPVERRAARLLQKQRAGAEVCFVNHAGGAEPVRAFIDDARSIGVTVAFIACVPVVVDEASAALLASFTTLVLPPGFLSSIAHAHDPRAAGIAAAITLGRELLDLDGVAGLNFSGGAAPGHEVAYAEAQAEVAAALR